MKLGRKMTKEEFIKVAAQEGCSLDPNHIAVVYNTYAGFKDNRVPMTCKVASMVEARATNPDLAKMAGLLKVALEVDSGKISAHNGFDPVFKHAGLREFHETYGNSVNKKAGLVSGAKALFSAATKGGKKLWSGTKQVGGAAMSNPGMATIAAGGAAYDSATAKGGTLAMNSMEQV